MTTKIMEARRRRTKIERRILRLKAGLHQGVEIILYIVCYNIKRKPSDFISQKLELLQVMTLMT